jgi:hypothetical protein
VVELRNGVSLDPTAQLREAVQDAQALARLGRPFEALELVGYPRCELANRFQIPPWNPIEPRGRAPHTQPDAWQKRAICTD